MDVDANAAHLIELNIDQILYHGGLKETDFDKKLICYGSNDVAVFHRTRSGVMQRLKTKHAPYVIPVYDFAH